MGGFQLNNNLADADNFKFSQELILHIALDSHV